MSSLQIGSQEWRQNSHTNEGLWEQGLGFLSLSTRCGLSAPGRSAGMAHRWPAILKTSGEIWWIVDDDADWYKTRAEAARAAVIAGWGEETARMYR